MQALMKPRTIAYLDCKTCGQQWVYVEIDTNGNGPCCRRTQPLRETERLELDLKRVKERMLAKDEENRVLKLANKSLSRVVSPDMAELLTAAQAWRDTYGGHLSSPESEAKHMDSEYQLLAALAAVEEAK